MESNSNEAARYNRNATSCTGTMTYCTSTRPTSDIFNGKKPNFH